jgi:hypothetical protein
MTKTVMAVRPGVYDHYREEGDVFEIREDKHFSKAWMTEVSNREALALQRAAQLHPEAERHVVDTSVVDNAELEALRAQLAESHAEIERLKRPTRQKAGTEGKSANTTDAAPKTAAEVLAMANDPSVEFMAFKSAARKVLGDTTPATKAEIVAALEDKATQP